MTTEPAIKMTQEILEKRKSGLITSSEMIRQLKQFDHTWGYIPGDQWNDAWVRGSVDYIELAYYTDVITLQELEEIWPHLVRTFNVSKPYLTVQD